MTAVYDFFLINEFTTTYGVHNASHYQRLRNASVSSTCTHPPPPGLTPGGDEN